MCGRFHLANDPLDVLRATGAVIGPNPRELFEQPRYNISPSEAALLPDSKRRTPPRVTRVPIVRTDGGVAKAESALWPLVPRWANGLVTKYSTANARAETMRESRSYRPAWEGGQRCLIPATGFYEWQDAGERTKQPWSLEPMNDGFFLFGGLWEVSCATGGEPVLSFTIVTVPANPLMVTIHNAGKNRHRMPLILDPEQQTLWLEGTVEEAEAVIRPYPADEMTARTVSRAINNPGRDEPDVLESSATERPTP